MAGKSIVNVVPTPAAESTWIRPPACLTIASTLARPMALPPASSLAKNGSNSLDCAAADIPPPVSATTIRTYSRWCAARRVPLVVRVHGGRHRQVTAVRHGVTRVDAEVEHDLFEVARADP